MMKKKTIFLIAVAFMTMFLTSCSEDPTQTEEYKKLEVNKAELSNEIKNLETKILTLEQNLENKTKELNENEKILVNTKKK